jgi:hypothetical protein
MSVKDFFGFATIKLAAIEFLKVKADFDLLSGKHKKPFRGFLSKHHSLGANLAADLLTGESQDIFVSDGFNSIKCQFSQLCQDNFECNYPSSIKLHTILNMLVCI